MTADAPDPSHVEWLRAFAYSSQLLPAGSVERLNAIASEFERKDARIGELQAMLEVGCDICGGAHHNNQHDLIEQLHSIQRRCGKAEAFIAELAAVKNHEGWQGKYFQRAKALAGAPGDKGDGT